MGRVSHDHFCLMIFGQDAWKEGTAEKIEDLTKSQFFYYAGHSECDTCSTCPICRALVELFDPRHPGEYVIICDFCKAFYNLMRVIQGKNDGMILLSHALFPEKKEIIPLVNSLLESNNIKKIYIMEVRALPISTPPSLILKDIKENRLKRLEFIALISAGKFEEKTLYEIFKDNYY